MIDAVAAEWLKFRSLRSNFYLLACSLLSVLICVGIAVMVTRGWDNQGLADRLRFPAMGDGFGTGLPVAYFVIAAIGALSITAEHATGQIGTSLTAVPRRHVLLLSKAPVLAGVGLVAGEALAFGMHYGTLAVLGPRASTVLLSGEPLANTESLTGTVLAGASVAPAALIGLGLGAAIRSTAGTIVTLAMLLFVLPILAQALPRPWNARVGAFSLDTLSTGGGLLPAPAAVALLAAYTVAALSAGAVVIAAWGRRLKPLVAGVVLTGLLSSVLVAQPALAGTGTPSTLAWRPCPKQRDVRCASVEVPVDWSKPGGRKIALPVGMLPATGTKPRLGVLFAIPGGPGGDGIEDLTGHGASFAAIRERFDVVSLNPRNGISLGLLSLDCLVGGPWLTLPRTGAAYDALGGKVRAAAEKCRAKDPEVFDHADSASVARDIDAIRAALGEQRMSFVATSYGGLPALHYARLFPRRIRAMYLDGVVNPLLSRAESQKLRYQAIEGQFARFTAWCEAGDECVLRGRDPGKVWRALVARADRKPIPAGKTRYSGFDLTVAAAPDVISPFPDYHRWKELADAIARADRGDATGFADYVRVGTRSEKPPSAVGMNMTHCLDGLVYRDYAEYRDTLAASRALSPNFAGNESWHPLGCVGWPNPVTNPPIAPPAHGLPPFLGAGTWTDYADTADVTLRVPGSGTIRFDGSGHGLYLTGDACTISHANRYLVELRLPPRGTVCRPS